MTNRVIKLINPAMINLMKFVLGTLAITFLIL